MLILTKMFEKKLMAAIVALCIWMIIISATFMKTQNGCVSGKLASSILYTRHNLITTVTERKKHLQDNADCTKNISYYPMQTVPLRSVSRVFYTAVPKCASSSTHSLLVILKTKNKFSYPGFISTIENRQQLQSMCSSCKGELRYNWELAVTEHMTNQTEPALISGHVSHIDFPLFMDGDLPVHFSMIRDPLNRHVSQFYFHKKSRKYLPHINIPPVSVTYDECVERDIEYCTSLIYDGSFNIIPFFCGIQPTCIHENNRALQIAKSNLLKDYAVVGLMEYYPESLQLLETILPEYFSGVMNVYREERITRNVAEKKATLKNSTITKMKSLLKMEYEFYHFAKQRFFTQYQTLFQRSPEH